MGNNLKIRETHDIVYKNINTMKLPFRFGINDYVTILNSFFATLVVRGCNKISTLLYIRQFNRIFFYFITIKNNNNEKNKKIERGVRRRDKCNGHNNI